MSRIFLASPHMSDEGYEQSFVKEAFDTNWIAPLGANVTGFENELAEFVSVDYASALVSGTSAIHLALILAGVTQNDTVFCQSLTFSASANPIKYQGATPIFIDSDFETWNMCPKALRKAFLKYPQTKAVIVVHLYGLCANLGEIIEVCNENGAVLIEDSAESLGTTYKGKHTGTFGEFGVYSFNGNKIITTSGGGMLVSSDKTAIEKSRFLATQSREPFPYYEHKELGFNYRMSNVSAGIGRGQLKVLNQRIAKKQYIYNFYKRNFACIDEISFMPENSDVECNYWLSCILLNGPKTPCELIARLEENNIECRHFWKPMHLQPFFKDCEYFGEDVSQRLFETGVCLPSDTKMTDEDLTKIVDIIKGFFNV